ncbi:MAG: formylglycine-generating enzyme family protein [Methanosarcina sp.]
MGSKISIINHINTVRSCLKKKEIEDSCVVTKFGNSGMPETFTSSSTGMEFVLIPAGKFDMGSFSEDKDRSDYESPAHKVTIKNPFYMGKSSVTQKQWNIIMGTSPSHFKGEARPVEMVSWEEVQEFVKKLNAIENTDQYRLPSEAEWEYACRAGTQTRYFFGNDESKLNEYAWYDKNSGRKTHPIGQKKPNSWGLYDMHGNVWEWVQDKWHNNYNLAPSDGSAWEGGDSFDRVSRGCSWYCSAGSCSSARLSRKPESRFANLGFRLLREL